MNSTQNHENSFEKIDGQRQILFACLWKANESSERANEQFQERIPRLMKWLKGLRTNGNLVACGGGAYGAGSETETGGGLTIIRARSYSEALDLSNGTPMNEIGTTSVLLWDIFYGSLSENTKWAKSE